MDASLRTRAEELASEIASQAETADDLNGLMRLMMKSAMERMLDTEMDVHLGRKGTRTSDPPPAVENALERPAKKGPPNRRNGHPQKTVKGDLGEVTIEMPVIAMAPSIPS